MLYRILRIIVGLGIRLYYKEILVKNKKALDHEGPMIIIANHPNTLMDAWMIGFVNKRPIYFMAKGTFFNSPIKRKILTSLNMIPINRKTDGAVRGINNKDSFEACYELLEKGKTLVIFPEGNSFPERKLRQLKSGTARIALETEKRNEGKLNLKIVPIGLFYSQAEKFRSSVMISIENGLYAKEFLKDFESNTTSAARQLTEKMRIHLERVLYTAEEEEEHFLERLYQVYGTTRKMQNVAEEAQWREKIKQRITEIQLLQPYLIEEIQGILYQIEWRTQKMRVQADILHKGRKRRSFLLQGVLSGLLLLVGFPFFVIGYMHNIIPYRLTDFIVPKITNYKEYYAPLAVLLSLIFYPLFYIGFLLLAKYIFDLSFWEQLIYFISMPVLGLYAHSFARYFKRIGYKWKYLLFIINQTEALNELRALKKQLDKMLLD